MVRAREEHGRREVPRLPAAGSRPQAEYRARRSHKSAWKVRRGRGERRRRRKIWMEFVGLVQEDDLMEKLNSFVTGENEPT